MLRKMTLTAILTVTLGLMYSGGAGANGPELMTYSGIIPQGVNQGDEYYDITFSIYPSQAGGDALWSETQSVYVYRGTFAVWLGAVNRLNLGFDAPYWVGVKTGGREEIWPLMAGYAMPAPPVTAGGVAAPQAVLADEVLSANIKEADNVSGQNTNTGSGVKTGHIANNAVTAGKIAANAVTTAKIANSAVTSAKIADGTIATADIANGAVTDAKITGLISAAKINSAGLNADTVDSKHAVDFAAFAHNHDSTYVNEGQTNSVSGPMISVPLSLSGSSSSAIMSAENYDAPGPGISGVSSTYGGSFSALGNSGTAVFGQAIASGAAANFGGKFTAAGDSGNGVRGQASGNSGIGVFGTATATGNVANYGGYFYAGGAGGSGIYAGGNGHGVYAKSVATSGVKYGVRGETASVSAGAAGVYGAATSPGAADQATAGYFTAAGGNSTGVYAHGGEYGVLATGNHYAVNAYGGTYGVYAGGGSTGVRGFGKTGVMAIGNGTSMNAGIYAENSDLSNGYAGYFFGKVWAGKLEKGSGSFKIDHPLDPENKYLYHSFVESPDMKNIYDGTVFLDERGEAWVDLPDWFEALNKDFRYQLTCIGGYAPVHIAEKMSGNRFKIGGGTEGLEVSWQVTGIRKDAFANAHRIQVEVPKVGDEKGKYLFPVELGQPAEKGIVRSQFQEGIDGRMR